MLHMSSKPTIRKECVSTIVLNYNRASFLEHCLESIINQTYSNIQIIVVDNGSEDNSTEILSRFKNNIEVVYLENNVSQGQARNLGVSKSSGEFLAFLDSDDYWHRDKISRQMAFISKSVSLVYCGVTLVSHDESRYVHPAHKGYVYDAFMHPRCEAVVIAGESGALLTRNLFDKVRGFAPELHTTAGWDFFLRCSKVSRIDYIDEPLVFVRIHNHNLSKDFLLVAKEMTLAYTKAICENSSLKRIQLLKNLIYFFVYLIPTVINKAKNETLSKRIHSLFFILVKVLRCMVFVVRT